MFYEPAKVYEQLPHDPLKALVAPRPIGWISTLSSSGTANLAPYSFFNLVGDAHVMFSSLGRKHSLINAEATGEFVCSLATYALRDAMNATAAHVPGTVDEFELAGLEKAASRLVAPPRVAASPVALECRYVQTLTLEGDRYSIIIGRVVGVHIDDAFLRDGIVDTAAMQPIARLGYAEYAVVDKAFELGRPS
jgi:flavin reductase (DIM6/NTAB) family NADH-FMN oxidoreductase RutF